MTNFTNKFLWLIFLKHYLSDEFFWRIFLTNFSDEFFWRIFFLTVSVLQGSFCFEPNISWSTITCGFKKDLSSLIAMLRSLINGPGWSVFYHDDVVVYVATKYIQIGCKAVGRSENPKGGKGAIICPNRYTRVNWFDKTWESDHPPLTPPVPMVLGRTPTDGRAAIFRQQTHCHPEDWSEKWPILCCCYYNQIWTSAFFPSYDRTILHRYIFVQELVVCTVLPKF